MSRVFFDAVLEPNRPMGAKGIVLLLGLVAGFSFVAGIVFVIHGERAAITSLWSPKIESACVASVRAAKRREHLILTQDALLIERIGTTGQATREEINPYWLRVDHDDPDLLGAQLALVSRGKRWVVGSFLGAEERASLAEALRNALRQARDHGSAP